MINNIIYNASTASAGITHPFPFSEAAMPYKQHNFYILSFLSARVLAIKHDYALKRHSFSLFPFLATRVLAIKHKRILTSA